MGLQRSQKKNATLQKGKRGGQPGNQNANSGPPENKNAVKTGEFETLFFDCLEPDEQKLIQTVQPDKEQLLLQEIQLLTVRERRMLKRIESLKLLEQTSDPEDDQGEDELEKAPPGMSVTKYKSGMEKGKANTPEGIRRNPWSDPVHRGCA